MRFWSSQGLMYIDGKLTQMTVFETNIGSFRKFSASRPTDTTMTTFCRVDDGKKVLVLSKVEWLQSLCKWVTKFEVFQGYEVSVVDEV